MDDPAKRDWRRKIETRASSLAGGLLFLRPIRPASASKPLFIREHPCHPWFIFSLQPRSACSLLKWEELTLCVLGVFGGQNAFGSSAVLGSRHSVSREKFSEIFLKPSPLQPMPVCIMIARVWNRTPNE
jgi:hypothetical protein